MTDPATETSTSPPPPPRQVSSLVSRRIWLEPHVRFWWISAGAMLVIGLTLGGMGFVDWSRQNRLITAGLAIQAKVVTAGGIYLDGKKIPPAEPVVLKYDANGQQYQVNGYLEGRNEHIIVGEKVPIRVDPDNPKIWTYRTAPSPLASLLLGSFIVLSVALLVGAIGMLKRASLVRLWKSGLAQAALVLKSHHSAMAPGARVVECTRRDSIDRRILRVFVPTSIAKTMNRGDVMWVIARDDKSTSAVAAAWFE